MITKNKNLKIRNIQEGSEFLIYFPENQKTKKSEFKNQKYPGKSELGNFNTLSGKNRRK